MRTALPLLALALAACAPDAAKVDADIRKFAAEYIATTDVPGSTAMLDELEPVTGVSGEGKITRGRDAIRAEGERNAARFCSCGVFNITKAKRILNEARTKNR